jgi:hypothetical protein
MRVPNATLGDLHEQDLGAHVHLLCEDWNEPTRYEVGESWVWNNARTWIVITPITMWFDDPEERSTERGTETWVVTTYEQPGEGDWVSITCLDPNTGRVVYQLENSASRRVERGTVNAASTVGFLSEEDRASIAHEYLEEQEEKRGELAGSPDTLPCYECMRQLGRQKPPEVKVEKLGPIAEARRDPTQTYVLSCGHITM